MRINTNLWNKIRYTLYAPGYDLAGRILDASRKKSIENLNLKPNANILIVGAGTGLDLHFLPQNCTVIATDITPAMVKKIEKRNIKLGGNVQTKVMDGQALDFADNTFDYVILHLILSVIPNEIACINEAERVLKPGGKVAVFDKFVKKNTKASTKRKIANVITNLFFSDITRSFELILAHSNLSVLLDIDANLSGNFRIIQLQKN
jgi:ubiquinone/menaquinone biosynthesis C-methylase UbiE